LKRRWAAEQAPTERFRSGWGRFLWGIGLFRLKKQAMVLDTGLDAGWVDSLTPAGLQQLPPIQQARHGPG
jgi:hypothetical protein